MTDHKDKKDDAPKQDMLDTARLVEALRNNSKKPLVRLFSNNKELGLLLKEIRERSGLSQQQMHELSGLSISTLRKNEQGIHKPSAVTFLIYLLISEGQTDHIGSPFIRTILNELLSQGIIGSKEA